MIIPFFQNRKFVPGFPIIPIYATVEIAKEMLQSHAPVVDEDPGTDKAIAHVLMVADDGETRISVGLWEQRVRFVNYRTSQFNQTDRQKAQKLQWFVDYYGGAEEFDAPGDTGYMIFWRNPKKKIVIVFGLHMGPVRIIDEDETHWNQLHE